jgi:hypothetical protein
MRRLTKVRIAGVVLLVVVLAAGSGVVFSQSSPGGSSGWETPSGWQPCPTHPCEGWVYEVLYNKADGKIEGAFARAPSEDAPPPGSGIGSQPGMAVIVLTDPTEQRLLGELMADSKSQDYYVDLETLSLNKRADTLPAPSATADPASFPFGGLGVLPPLAMAAGIGLSAVALIGARRRSSR